MDCTRPKTVVVLGAGSPIGRAVCDRYLKSGYQVLACVHRQPLSSLSDQEHLREIQLDFSNPSDVEAFLESSTKAVSADALVCLAADSQESSLQSVTASELMRALAIGTVVNYLFLGKLGAAMASRNYGRIVLASSIGVKFGGGLDSFAYSLSKHASEFIPQEARSWAKSGVLTNVVRLGVTQTGTHVRFPGRDWSKRLELIPMGRAASVAESADFIYWHGSEHNTFVTGQIASISGGE